MPRALPRLRLTAAALLAGGLAALFASVPSPAQAERHVDPVAETAWAVDGPVYATVIVGDTVVVGGDFTRAVSPSGTTARRDNIAAFSLRSGQPLSQWQPSADGPVRAMVSDGSSIWLGGEFRNVNGKGKNRIVKISAQDGSVDKTFTGSANGVVRTLALQGNWLYAGGDFDKANNNAPRLRVAKFKAATGDLDAKFQPQPDGVVRGIVANPVTDEVYLAGSFYEVNGEEHRAVAAVDGRTGAVRDILFRPVATTLGLDISPDGHLLYAATGGEINGASAYNTETGARVFRKRVDGDVQAVRYFDGNLYFGFHKGFEGRTGIKLLAADAWNGTIDQDFRPRIAGYWGIHAIAASDAAVVVGGNIKSINGVSKQGFGVFKADLPSTSEYVGGVTPWRFLDLGIRPDGWESSGFDDSGWAPGLASFGYGDGDERTVVTSGPAPKTWFTTSYYRTTFDLDSLPLGLVLKLAADDGAVVYLNGVEVTRDNMPEGTVRNTTRATIYRTAAEEELLRSFALDPAALTLGTNTLAIEVHQASGGGSDLTFDARLIGTAAP